MLDIYFYLFNLATVGHTKESGAQLPRVELEMYRCSVHTCLVVYKNKGLLLKLNNSFHCKYYVIKLAGEIPIMWSLEQDERKMVV